MKELNGHIFQIQKFSIHDGPGIRTTFFLKGCNNRCSWCHNPESISPDQSMEWNPGECIGCGECIAICRAGARSKGENQVRFDRKVCSLCGQCASVCYSGAIKLTGRILSLEEAIEEALSDKVYYRKSDGGVTLSGGEPFMQPEFTLEFLKSLKTEDIHTVVQTAGAYDYNRLKESLPWIDLIMFDLKGFSPEVYGEYISDSRDLVYSNLEKLLGESGIETAVRTPLIGGVNDSDEEIESIARWLRERSGNLKYYQLVPYHELGKDKYEKLGKSYPYGFYRPSNEVIGHLEEIASQYVPVKENESEKYSLLYGKNNCNKRNQRAIQ